MTRARSTFLFDGDCAFCTLCAQFIERRIPTSAHVTPWQWVNLHEYPVTKEECGRAIQWIGTDGTHAAGPDALGLLLRDAGRAWAPLGSILALAPARAVAWPLYHWIAANREKMPGATAACALPPR